MKKVRFQQTLVVCKGLPCLAFPVTFFVVCTDFDDDATVQSWIFFAPKELGWRSDNVGMLMKVKDVGVEVWFCFLSRYIRNNWWAKHHAMICANATLDRIIAFFPEPFLKTDCVWDILGPSPAIADLCSTTEKQRWRSAGSNTSKSCFMQRDSMVTWIFQPFLGSSENTKLQTYTLSQSIRWSCDQVLQRQVLGDFILCLLWKFPISSENKPTSMIIIRQKQSRHTHNNYIQKMHLRILQNKAKTVKEIYSLSRTISQEMETLWFAMNGEGGTSSEQPMDRRLKTMQSGAFQVEFSQKEGRGRLSPGRPGEGLCFFLCLCVKNVFFEVNQMWLSMVQAG